MIDRLELEFECNDSEFSSRIIMNKMLDYIFLWLIIIKKVVLDDAY